MDPEATIRLIIDHEDTESAMNLAFWLGRGGFLPSKESRRKAIPILRTMGRCDASVLLCQTLADFLGRHVLDYINKNEMINLHRVASEYERGIDE